MVLDPSKTDGLSASDLKFLNIVNDFGWHVMKVAPRVGDEGHLWAYSTGLYYSYGHPEILMLNLRLDAMHAIINLIGASVKKGKKFEPGKPTRTFLRDAIVPSSLFYRPTMKNTWGFLDGFTKAILSQSCSAFGQILAIDSLGSPTAAPMSVKANHCYICRLR